MNRLISFAIRIFTLTSLVFIQIIHGQTLLDLRSQVKNIDFRDAPSTRPFKSGTVLPATCVVGESYFKTDAPAGSNLFGCTAANIWTLQGSAQLSGDVSGSASAATVTALRGRPVSSATPSDGSVLRWSSVDAQWAPTPGGTASAGVVTSSQLADLNANVESASVLTIAAGRWGFGSATFSLPQVTATIRSVNITAATNTTPIVVTVSSVAGIRSGDTLTVSGVEGNTAANGTWTVVVINTRDIQLLGSNGNGNYTSGGTISGTGNGTAYVYANESGSITIEHASSAALLLTCVDRCITNQVVSPSFPPTAAPIAVVTISNGGWTSVEDKRRFMTGSNAVAGLGINIRQEGGVANINVDSTVARLPGQNTWTGENSFTAASRTAPCRMGTGAPDTQRGTQGDCYFQQDAVQGQHLWFASTTGTPATWVRPSSTVGPTGVTAGTYTNPRLTIAADGRVTSALSLSGGGSGKLDWQKRQTDVPVNSTADAVLYSTSLSSATLGTGECVRITAQFQQQYSSFPADYKLWIGNTSQTVAASNATQGVMAGSFLVCNDPGSVTSQQISSRVDWFTNSTGTTIKTAAENMANAIQVKLTARFANGSGTVTPWAWLVEAVR